MNTNNKALPADDRTVEEKIRELKEITQQDMQTLRIPGVAVGLTVKGVDYYFSYGITSIENPLEVTPQTLFRIGSTTKTITGMLIMVLMEQGKLNLDDKIRKYLPDFKVQDEYTAANATVRHLLNHTAGWVGDIFLNTGRGDDSLEKYVARMADVPQHLPLGAVFAYNNASLNIAGRIIEVICGKPYEDVVQEMVLEPLEMTNSFFHLGDIIMRRFAIGHLLKDDQLILGRPYEEDRSSNACGGLVSDVIDQIKYARFHMGDGCTASGRRLLSEETMQLMQTPTIPAGGDMKMGLTWHIEETNGIKLVSHGGSCVGQQSSFWMAPAEQTAMTVLTNQDGGTVLHNRLDKWVKEHILGISESIPEPLLLQDAELALYMGDYVLSPTNDIFSVNVKNGRLILTHKPGDVSSMFETPPEPYPPMQAAIFETDRFIILDEPLVDFKGEFLRSSDGKSPGFDWGAGYSAGNNNDGSGSDYLSGNKICVCKSWGMTWAGSFR